MEEAKCQWIGSGFKLNKLPLKKQEKVFYRYNYNKLQRIAMTKNWNVVETMHDPDKATSFWIDEIRDCLDKSKKETRAKNNKRHPRKDWITKAIVLSCKKKEKLYRKRRNEPNNNIIKLEYKNYVNRLSKVLQDAKIKHERNIVKNNSWNVKQLWKYINSKMGTKAQKDISINKLTLNNNGIIENETQIANHMNSYFCRIGSELADKIIKPHGKLLHLPPMNEKSICIRPTNNAEKYYE